MDIVYRLRMIIAFEIFVQYEIKKIYFFGSSFAKSLNCSENLKNIRIKEEITTVKSIESI